MSDVFISYAREDRSLAAALANDLQQKGFGVWWDAELVGADNFQDAILAALSRARAAIVIWTKNSVASNFVRDEARYALFHNKLIATKVGELEVIDIPFGFQSQHTEDVLSRDKILRAVQKLGVQPASSPANKGDSWEEVRNSRDGAKLLAWIGQNPTHPSHAEAVALVQKLFEGSRAAEAIPSISEPVVRRGKLQAFFRGLIFLLPRFQLAEEGKWSSIGLTVTLLVVFLSAAYIWVLMLFVDSAKVYIYLDLFGEMKLAVLAVTFHTLLAWFLSYLAINRWIAQRNFQAALITAPAFVLSFVGLSLGFAGTFNHYKDLITTAQHNIPETGLPLIALLGLICSLLYLGLKFNRSR